MSPARFGFNASDVAVDLFSHQGRNESGAHGSAPPADAISLTNVPLSGLQTIDGYDLVNNDRVLLVGQLLDEQNGPWLAHAGAWTRPTDFDTDQIVRSHSVDVMGGQLHLWESWELQTTTGVQVDSDPQVWVLRVPRSDVVPAAKYGAYPGAEGFVSKMALASASVALRGGGIVQVDAGEHDHDEADTYWMPVTGAEWRGAGIGKTIINGTDVAGSLLIYSDPANGIGQVAENVGLSHMTIACNSEIQGPVFNSTEGLRIDEVEILDAGSAALLLRGCSRVRSRGVHVKGVTGAGSSKEGVWLFRGNTDVQLSNYLIEDADGTGLAIDAGTNDGAGIVNERIVISNTIVRNSGRHGAIVEGGRNVVMTGMLIDGSGLLGTGYGLFVSPDQLTPADPNTYDLKFDGQINGSQFTPIVLQGSARCQIRAHIHDVFLNGSPSLAPKAAVWIEVKSDSANDSDLDLLVTAEATSHWDYGVYISGTYPAAPPLKAQGNTIKLHTGRGAGLGAPAIAPLYIDTGVDEEQTITITGSPAAGTWKPAWGGDTAATGLAINATATDVRQSLESLTTLDIGDIAVSGPDGGPWKVHFTGTKGKQNVAAITTTNTFTGGSSPAAAVTTTIPGVARNAAGGLDIPLDGPYANRVLLEGPTFGRATSGGSHPTPYEAALSADTASITSQTTLQDVLAELALNIGDSPTEIWDIYLDLLISAANATMDCKVGFVWPAGCTAYWGPIVGTGVTVPGWGATTTGGSPAALNTHLTGALNYATLAGINGLSFKIKLLGGGTAGPWRPQIAQATSDVGALKALRGCTMTARQVKA